MEEGQTIVMNSGRRVRLDKFLSLGGQGLTYRATDLRTGGQCIVKVFHMKYCTPETKVRTAAQELFEAYKSWTNDAGERPMSQRALKKVLESKGLTRIKDSKNFWVGIGIRQREDSADGRQNRHFPETTPRSPTRGEFSGGILPSSRPPAAESCEVEETIS